MLYQRRQVRLGGHGFAVHAVAEVSAQPTLVFAAQHGNNESWVVEAALDVVHCNASVDFHVAGKPAPPPVKSLQASSSPSLPPLCI